MTAANVTVLGTLNAASKAAGALATAGDGKGETHGERALREHLVEQAEQGAAASEASEEDLPVYVMVTVPEGVTPGTPVGIKSPSGESLEVDVPEEYTAGETFPVVIQMVESHFSWSALRRQRGTPVRRAPATQQPDSARPTAARSARRKVVAMAAASVDARRGHRRADPRRRRGARRAARRLRRRPTPIT